VVHALVCARRSSTCIEIWDHGGQHGQESKEGEEGEEGKEEDRQEKEVGLRLYFLRHIKVRAVCLRELMLPRFDVIQRRSIAKPDHEARIRRPVRLFHFLGCTRIVGRP